MPSNFPDEVDVFRVVYDRDSAPTPADAIVLASDHNDIADAVTAVQEHLLSPAGSGGGSLADLAYAPGSPASYAISSTSFGDIDATNLKVTFEAPDSGIVWINVTIYKTNGPNSGNLVFRLHDGTNPVGLPSTVGYNMAEALLVHPVFRVAGLTPEQEYTFTLQARVTAGTSGVYADSTVPIIGRVVPGKA